MIIKSKQDKQKPNHHLINEEKKEGLFFNKIGMPLSVVSTLPYILKKKTMTYNTASPSV